MSDATVQPIVIGTAGHIDHGKTALVRELTGVDTDRLKEEKERGITTELGFAHLDLDGKRYGVVDVPGHERFIKSMVAGAGGLDLVCLVIAADEGIMPQTREHLDVCELLGVRRGIVTLSKSDLVDAEWLELVAQEIRTQLAGTFLEEAPIIPVSAKTGAGISKLRETIREQTARLEARPTTGVFRLPVDRVFAVKGFGTVVTGTISSGSVNVGDTLVSVPSEQECKVRGIENHGESLPRATAGMRCALNLTGVARQDLARGDILTHPGALRPSHLLDVRFRYLKSSVAPLPRQSRILLHHGTAQLNATLVLVGRDQLLPGEESLAQLRFDATAPIAALPGDRFIARGFVVQEHYGTTIGGGEVVRVHAPKVRRSATAAAQTVERIAASSGDERVALEIRAAQAACMDLDELARRLGRSHELLGSQLQRLTESGEVVVAERHGRPVYCHAEPFAGLEKRALDLVRDFYERDPRGLGMPREELRTRLSSALPVAMFERVLAALVRRKALVESGDTVKKPDADVAARAALSALDRKILEAYDGWALTPPRPNDVAKELGCPPHDAKAALSRLIQSKLLVRVRADLYVHADAVQTLKKALVAHLEANGEITPAQWKQLTGASRKFSIPLAEYFDAEKLTLRVGDVRKLR